MPAVARARCPRVRCRRQAVRCSFRRVRRVRSFPAVLTVYGFPRSSNALKVRFLLEELSLPYGRSWCRRGAPTCRVPRAEPDRQGADARRRAARAHASRTRSCATSPVARAGTICTARHLATQRGSTSSSTASRSCSALRSSRTSGSRSATYRAAGSSRRHGDREAARETRRRRSRRRSSSFDGLVAADGTVLGHFTIADCAIAPSLYRTTHSGLDLEPYPNLQHLRDDARRATRVHRGRSGAVEDRSRAR